MKCVLSIAGSDSGGGAGIQADLKTFAALGVHGATAITAITAQNTLGVKSVCNLSADMVEAQIDAVVEDLPIRYVKTGMLSTPEIAHAVAGRIRKHGLKAVVDPVMAAEAGGSLMESETLQIYRKELIPQAVIVTPNTEEAGALTDIEVKKTDDAVEAAIKLHGMGARAVVVTGGHLDGRDVLVFEGSPTIIEGELISTAGTHGGGCTFSAALTAYLALGYDIESAVRGAKRFTTEAIRRSKSIGAGAAPVNQLGELLENEDRR